MSDEHLEPRSLSAAALVMAAVEGRLTFEEVRAELRRRDEALRRPISFLERSTKEDDD